MHIPTLAPTLAACTLLCLLGSATAGARPPSAATLVPTDAPRLQTIEQQLLPAAQRALQQHERQCNTQRAVLHARQAMASGEAALGSPSGLWHDIEMLTAQCEAGAQPLRATLQQLQAEQAQLLQAAKATAAAQPTTPIIPAAPARP